MIQTELRKFKNENAHLGLADLCKSIHLIFLYSEVIMIEAIEY